MTSKGSGSGDSGDSSGDTPPIPAEELNDLVSRVGGRIRAGLVTREVGHDAIGAVCAWKPDFPDIAFHGMNAQRISDVEKALVDAGVEIPWPHLTSTAAAPEPASGGGAATGS